MQKWSDILQNYRKIQFQKNTNFHEDQIKDLFVIVKSDRAFTSMLESYRINLMPQVVIHYTSHSGVISNVTNVVETGDARKSGRIRRNGSATRELHKPVQASLYDPKPRPLSFRAKLIHRILSPHNLFPLAPLNYDNRWKSIVKFDRHLIRKNLKVPFPFLTIFHFYISHVMAAWHVTSVGP